MGKKAEHTAGFSNIFFNCGKMYPMRNHFSLEGLEAQSTAYIHTAVGLQLPAPECLVILFLFNFCNLMLKRTSLSYLTFLFS